MQQLTAVQIIQQASVELGLPKPNSVASSAENTAQQMLALLNSAGIDMLNAHPWQQLTKLENFHTIKDKDMYALPSDYGYYIDQTFWDRTNFWDVPGPITPQQWQALESGIAVVFPREVFRVTDNSMQIYPVPGDNVYDLSYQYVTNNWVVSGNDPGVFIPYVVSDTDKPLLDGQLLVKYLKVKMWAAKGLDTSSLENEFRAYFNMLTGKDKGAQVLSLTRRAPSFYLGYRNVPDGNWNS
jgi:hypothetical protein